MRCLGPVVPDALGGVVQRCALGVELELAPARRAEFLQARRGPSRQALMHRAEVDHPRRLHAPLRRSELPAASAQGT